MVRSRVVSAVVLAACCFGIGDRVTGDSVSSRSGPDLVHTCLITANLDRLIAFYEPVLGVKAQRSGSDYAEFHTGAAVLRSFLRKRRRPTSPARPVQQATTA